MSNENTNIPLSKLVPWDGNVRKTGAADGIEELAASIAAHGLLQSLVVREAEDKRKRGKYEIVAGRRRYMALKVLVKDRTIAKDFPVPCMLVGEAANGTELSLAENAVRASMHPADQFEAFRDLIDGGPSPSREARNEGERVRHLSIADVAARFGVSEDLVAKRMKLGRVSPVVMSAYREGELSLEQVQAFALSDDHEAQERILRESSGWGLNPNAIKRALTEGEIPASDKRVRLVGLDAYEAAGGALRRDLFDPEDGGYVLDTALLENLVAKRLEEAAGEVRSEGWKWTEIVPEIDYGDLRAFERRYPEDVPLSDEDQAELAALAAEYDELVDTDEEAEVDRLAEIERRMDELEAPGEYWPEETFGIAGAVISIGYQGDIRVERGLVRPEDVPAEADEPADEDSAADRGSADEPAIKLSARLTEDLSAQKSAAISAELAGQPEVALAAVVHTLALQLFYNYERDRSCLRIAVSTPDLGGALYSPAACKGLTALISAQERWGDHLPGNPADLWAWCLGKPQDVLLDLLAFCAAQSVNAVLRKGDRAECDRMRHADALARAVGLDVSDYFTPGAENFFARISSAGILTALGEARNSGPAPSWAKMKKAELAALAEREIVGTGWLPEPLCIADEGDAAAVDDGELQEAAE